MVTDGLFSHQVFVLQLTFISSSKCDGSKPRGIFTVGHLVGI